MARFAANTGTDFGGERTMYIEAKIEKLLDLKKAIEIGPIAPLIEHAGSTMAHLNSQVH
jgi:hypothetical protein